MSCRTSISCPLTTHCMAQKPLRLKVRSVIHLHGGKTPPNSDGYPEHWVIPGKSLTFFYPNRQDAATLFYHDHTMGINRLNIYGRTAGHVSDS
jgi:FtsP/CotA-like multicopper oxidase with cupredoxin domain